MARRMPTANVVLLNMQCLGVPSRRGMGQHCLIKSLMESVAILGKNVWQTL